MPMRLSQKFLMTSGLIATMGLAACGGTDDRTAMDDTAYGDTTMAATATMPGARDFSNERNVFTYLNTANALEIQSAQLAATNATNPQVREFAQTLEQDHQQMQERLAPMMQGTPPEELDETDDLVGFHRDATEDLGDEERGVDYDRRWLEKQVDLHERMLNDLDDALRGNVTPELRTQITEAQTSVRTHLERARQLHQQLSGETATTPATVPPAQ